VLITYLKFRLILPKHLPLPSAQSNKFEMEKLPNPARIHFLKAYFPTNRIIALLTAFLLAGCDPQTDDPPLSQSPPTNLTCEYQANPLGVHTLSPRFSWHVPVLKRGMRQSAYRVLVASSPEALEENPDMWDSGKVASDSSVWVSYAGKPLKSGEQYFWKVCFWDAADKRSVFSKTAYFRMGLLGGFPEWNAAWIGNGDTGAPLKAIMLRKDFEVAKPLAAAVLHVTGLGSYRLHLNGKKVGDMVLTPGWTHYPERLQYQQFDITDEVKQGENAFGAMLGNLWWSSGLGWQGSEVYSQGPLRLLLSLHLTFADGSTEVVPSYDDWKWDYAPVTENTLYHGVNYDANLAQPGWDSPGFDDANWQNVQILEPVENRRLIAQQGPPMRITETYAPQTINRLANGNYVVDFGTNLVGRTAIELAEPAGQEVALKYAELLHDDGSVAQENLRSARATDRFISNGQPQTFEPYFTYHGFRYVEIEGLSQAPNIKALVIHSDAPISGSFTSSNELLNKIQRNIMRGQKGNMHSVPTDCPQRDERLGWMGDAQIFAPTSAYNMDMAGFFAKWMRDIADSQDEEEGFVHDVNPAIVVIGPAKPGWGDAVVVVPWVMWKFYGDTQIIEENFDAMRQWVAYMDRKAEGDIYYWVNDKGDWFGYGDWIAVEDSPGKPIGGAYFYYCNKLLSEMAGALGKTQEAGQYAQRAAAIAKAFNEQYFDAATGNYEGATQTANLLPLAFGMVPERFRQKVAANIAANVEEKGKHPTTGFLGTAYLLPILSEYGYHELAYETATQTDYPSWGYMVENGATSIWELWDSNTQPPDKMNSRNHFALGSVGEWFYGHLAGLRPTMEAPGFKKALIAPMPAGDLKTVSTTYGSNYGEYAIDWQLSDTQFELEIRVPGNTMAEVHIPKVIPNATKLTEGGTDLLAENVEVEGITLIGENAQAYILEVGAGEYSFTLAP